LLDPHPLLAADRAGNDIQRPCSVDGPFLLVVDGEGDAHRLDRKLRRLLAYTDFPTPDLREVAHQGPARGACAAPRADQLVVLAWGAIGGPVDAHSGAFSRRQRTEHTSA